MILGGLVGASPHMISASVMALARLLYEFAPQLEAAAPQLLPVVLSLLRSKSREVIKSVLGFVKVIDVRKSAVEFLMELMWGFVLLDWLCTAAGDFCCLAVLVSRCGCQN